jgi:hypothetical protein
MRFVFVLVLASTLPVWAAGPSRPLEWTPSRPHALTRTLKYRYLRARAAIANRVGELIGRAELQGFRYPVSGYMERVSPILERGSRVDAAMIARLHGEGYRAIVQLTEESDSDRAPAKADEMAYERIPLLDNSVPRGYGPIKQLMRFLSDADHTPAYIHCEAGKGRTGVMVAAYRMAMEGWNSARAIKEAREHGLSLRDQVLFLRQLGRDLDAIRDRQARGELGDGPAWQYL